MEKGAASRVTGRSAAGLDRQSDPGRLLGTTAMRAGLHLVVNGGFNWKSGRWRNDHAGFWRRHPAGNVGTDRGCTRVGLIPGRSDSEAHYRIRSACACSVDHFHDVGRQSGTYGPRKSLSIDLYQDIGNKISRYRAYDLEYDCYSELGLGDH